MEKDRQTKIILIVALFIGVITLTMVYAIFSAQLRIQSTATVTPDADSFKVVLSKEQTEEVVGKVIPTGDGKEAIISNIGTPTISNLIAHFINPGEKVEYELYVINTGDFDAYLNTIEYGNVTGSIENKVCIAGEGTTDEYVQSACESIRVTVKVGEDDKACQTSTYGAHRLDKNTGEKVLVTIEYANTGERADGPFNVEFGDIKLNYSTTDAEIKNVPSCTEYNTQIVEDPIRIAARTNIEDNDNNGIISLSDKVTLGTESFYVMSTNEVEGTVTMLAEWNLNVGNNPVSGDAGIQNSQCKGLVSSEENKYCTMAFSSTSYWNSTESTYPAWVYNSNSNLYTHVENYVRTLIEAGYSSVTGRLAKYEEIEALGCHGRGLGACDNAPVWVYNTSYWLGSAKTSLTMSHIYSNGNFNDSYSGNSTLYGVRPVIEISASEI